MAEFHIAIVGGCMSHQTGIPFNTLYHRQLAREVQSREGIEVRTHIARAHDLDYTGRLESLLQRGSIDGVLIHIRVMITKRTRLLIGSEGRRLGYSLHPALFSRTHSGAAIEELRADELRVRRLRRAGQPGPGTQPDRRRRAARVGGFRVRDLNTALGALVGLDRWAVDDEMVRLTEFVEYCRRRDLPLFVLGPTPLATTRWQARTIRLLNERLRAFCSASEIPFALVDTNEDDAGGSVLMPDGVHLSAAGHSLVAARLQAAGIGNWMMQT